MDSFWSFYGAAIQVLTFYGGSLQLARGKGRKSEDPAAWAAVFGRSSAYERSLSDRPWANSHMQQCFTPNLGYTTSVDTSLNRLAESMLVVAGISLVQLYRACLDADLPVLDRKAGPPPMEWRCCSLA